MMKNKMKIIILIVNLYDEKENDEDYRNILSIAKDKEALDIVICKLMIIIFKININRMEISINMTISR